MRSDRGAATVFALAMAAVLCTGGVVGLAVVESTVRHTRLGHIADSAALAAGEVGVHTDSCSISLLIRIPPPPPAC